MELQPSTAYRPMTLTHLPSGVSVDTMRRSELAGAFRLIRKMPKRIRPTFADLRHVQTLAEADYEFVIDGGRRYYKEG